MNVFNSQRETICTVENQKNKTKPTTPRERAEALGSRHTVDSLCFRDKPLLLVSCLVCVCWCFPGSTVVPLCQPTNHKRAFEVPSERDWGQTPRPLHPHTCVCQTKTTLHKNHPPPLADCSHPICQSFPYDQSTVVVN